MRYPGDMPRPSRRERRRERGRSSNRSRVVLAVVAVVVVILLLSLRAIATFWTDYLWFGDVDLQSVWRKLLSAKLTLGAGAALVFFLLLWVNMLVADRLAPRFVAVAGEDELLVRYRELVAGRQRLLWLVVAAVIAVVPGVSASSQWREWLLFRHGGSFGVEDPQFGTDIGFYVFDLPFLSQVVDWLFGFLVVTTLVVAVVHYLNGAIRLQPMGERVTPNAKAHLSVLLALAALVKAADYWLQRYELTFAPGRAFDGAGYTAVNARLPAVQLLILISVFVAVLLLANIWRRGWVLPVIVVALWALVQVVVGTAYPAFVQRFQVSPSELAKERPYIRRNIEATRTALGLDEVEQTDFIYDRGLTAEEVDAQRENLTNARLLDPEVMIDTIQDLEFGREYYRFRDVDVDRYLVEGAEGDVRTPVIISTRELYEEGIQNPTWEKLRLVFTHGYAAAVAPSNGADERGEPRFLVSGIPAEYRGLPELERPEIYHGEDMTGYAVVGTDQTELTTDQVSTSYEGDSGVPMSSLFRRAAFALRFGEIEPLISGSITEESRVIFQRDVRERVRAVAPFLVLDTDPYPVLVDGRIKYVVDAYTSTSNYPYSQHFDVSTVLAGQAGSFNYLRNSVKAVVDAYDGTVELYLTDTLYGERDPIVRAYSRAFPDLFTAEIPEALSRHFRYPELMFKVQTEVWGRYHQGDPDSFFNNTDRWDIAQQPPNSARLDEGGTGIDPASLTGNGELPRIEPYYQLLQLRPGDDPRFVLTRPFVLASRDDQARNLTALLVADNDPGDYGKLSQFVMSARGEDGEVERNTRVDGPLRINQKMVTYPPVSSYQALVGRAGSQVRFGNLLILPFQDSLLYVRPVYARQEQSGRFLLQRVVVAAGDSVGFGETLDQAVDDLLDENPDAPVVPPEDVIDEADVGQATTTTTTPPAELPAGSSAEELLAAADERFAEADAALRAGNLAGYQAAVQEAQQLVRQAAASLGASTTTTTTTTVPAGEPGGAGGGGTGSDGGGDAGSSAPAEGTASGARRRPTS